VGLSRLFISGYKIIPKDADRYRLAVAANIPFFNLELDNDAVVSVPPPFS